MHSEMPNAMPPVKRLGRLVELRNSSAHGRMDFRSTVVDELTLDFEGIVGNRHRGFTRGADARVPYLARGTKIRNTRQLSMVSVEDCAQIASRLRLERFDAGWLGANIVVAGIAHFSFLPRGTRLFFDGGTILIVEDQNAPCSIAGEAVMLGNPGRDDIKLAFPKHAKGLRGLVVTVEHPGVLTAGGKITARLPEQWIYV